MKNNYIKFEYDSDSFDLVKDKLVTSNGNKVEIISTKLSGRLVAIVSMSTEYPDMKEYEKLTTYTLDGKEIGGNGDLDLYIDPSLHLYVNIHRNPETDHIFIDGPYNTYEEVMEARENSQYNVFDTVEITCSDEGKLEAQLDKIKLDNYKVNLSDPEILKSW